MFNEFSFFVLPPKSYTSGVNDIGLPYILSFGEYTLCWTLKTRIHSFGELNTILCWTMENRIYSFGELNTTLCSTMKNRIFTLWWT